ncbi:MAG: NnrU family protein [Caulobacteraceae bacterium]|nr:NnrU family protein [Caulobacteraceae bacterium]
MTMLIASAAAFVLVHLLVSGTRLREVIIGVVDSRLYMGLFSLLSVGLLVWLGYGFAGAKGAAGDTVYWSATPATRILQLFLQLVAFLFAVIGLTTPNPTSVRQEGALDRPDVVRGMLRITRHPFLWGVAIWAAGHLMVNGDVASLILFGSMFALALFGTVSIDAKRERALGDAWNAFAERTSNIPFAAVAGGRQSVSWGEIGWRRPLLAAVLWAIMIGAHPHLFGGSALP